MNTNFERAAENAAAFQKMWIESASTMAQAALSLNPNADPEVVRQTRTGMFQALSESWEEFMRTPQFLEGMKQWMDNTVSCRKMTSELLGKVRNEMQAPSRDDIDTMMVAIRHLERRLLDRLDSMAEQLANFESQRTSAKAARPGGRKAPNGRARQTARREAPVSNHKQEGA